MSDFLKTKREEIAARLRELEPLVEEYRQLEAASAALAGLPGATRTARAPQRARRRAPVRAARAGKPATTGLGDAVLTIRARNLKVMFSPTVPR